MMHFLFFAGGIYSMPMICPDIWTANIILLYLMSFRSLPATEKAVKNSTDQFIKPGSRRRYDHA
ncbi:hypothetical protein F3J28_00750 [Enterobacter sp. Ap-1006]|nr:hypothetical protein [Enterobacter sp. Ap-1006]